MTEAMASLPSDTPLRLLHLTDLHLFANDRDKLRGVNTNASLAAVLDDIAVAKWDALAALATGDLIQDDTRAAYRRCRTHLEALGLPVILVPGNHDVRPLMAEELAGDPFAYCPTLELGRWSVICLDSCVDGRAGGHLADAEIEKLKDHLSSTASDFVLVCLHHPPVELGSRWLDSVGLDNGAELLDVAACGVRGMLFGHAHQAFDDTVAGVRLLGTPSTCRQFLPKSDEFATDDNPPAYRRLELCEDGTINTELIWVNYD